MLIGVTKMHVHALSPQEDLSYLLRRQRIEVYNVDALDIPYLGEVETRPQAYVFPEKMGFKEAVEHIRRYDSCGLWELIKYGRQYLKRGSVDQIVAFGARSLVNGVETYAMVRINPNTKDEVYLGTFREGVAFADKTTAALIRPSKGILNGI